MSRYDDNKPINNNTDGSDITHNLHTLTGKA